MSKTGETQLTTDIDPVSEAAYKPFVPVVAKHVTLPLFKWEDNKPRYLKITSPIFIGKEIQEKGAAKKKEPAHLMNVVDLETGEEGQVIVATVLRGILSEEYPGDAYVGKGFAITQRKIPGKDYNGYGVDELVLPS